MKTCVDCNRPIGPKSTRCLRHSAIRRAAKPKPKPVPKPKRVPKALPDRGNARRQLSLTLKAHCVIAREAGMSMKEIAGETGMELPGVYAALREYYGTPAYDHPLRTERRLARAARVVLGRIRGMTFREIGSEMGLSRSRAHQIWQSRWTAAKTRNPEA